MTGTRPIGFWLRLVDRLLEERFAEVLEEHGITRGQWQLLNVVSRGGGATAEAVERAVAPFTSADGEPVSSQLAELIESGWVGLGGTEYRLTKRGEVAHDRLAEVIGELRAHSTEGISSDDYASTLATLERMARNLGWSDE
jgi:DNA-binding MarR family transcriptional regulator